MVIKVWSNFNKKKNSTKRPVESEGTTINATLKEGTSIERPTFRLNSNDFTINYVYAFGHYYFKDDIISVGNNLIELVCTKDPLATHKNSIAGYRGFVEYTSASDNLYITDPRNKPTLVEQLKVTELPLDINFDNGDGVYLLGVVNGKVPGTTGMPSTGAICYYALTGAQLQLVMANIFGTQDIVTQIKEQFTSFTDSLVSCIWLPLNALTVLSQCTTSEEIMIGGTGIGYSARKLQNRIVSMSNTQTEIAFPSVDIGIDELTYIDKAPYTMGMVYLPMVGYVNLDLDLVVKTKTLAIGGHIDLVTGDIVYTIRTGGFLISTYSGNIATKMPLSSSAYDGVGVATGTIATVGGLVGSMIASVVSENPMVGVGGVASAIMGGINTAKSSEIHTMLLGSNSSAIGAKVATQPFVAVVTNIPTETDLKNFKAEQGMPYFKTATLSSLSGFIKCSNASISLDHDTDEVNAYLNSGFYLE